MLPHIGPIYTALGEWHPWFAWRPVLTIQGYRWLIIVDRRRYIGNDRPRHPFWVHRPHQPVVPEPAPVLVNMRVEDILRHWRPGSAEWAWDEEYADLIDDPVTDRVRERIDAEGFGFDDHLAPVLLGSDGRVWDGHHRIVIAMERGREHLMVEVC